MANVNYSEFCSGYLPWWQKVPIFRKFPPSFPQTQDHSWNPAIFASHPLPLPSPSFPSLPHPCNCIPSVVAPAPVWDMKYMGALASAQPSSNGRDGGSRDRARTVMEGKHQGVVGQGQVARERDVRRLALQGSMY